MAKALREGDVNAIGVTVRSDAAFEAIRTITGEYPYMMVGAGTIHNNELVQQAPDA